jgi:hypothetical protein
MAKYTQYLFNLQQGNHSIYKYYKEFKNLA